MKKKTFHCSKEISFGDRFVRCKSVVLRHA